MILQRFVHALRDRLALKGNKASQDPKDLKESLGRLAQQAQQDQLVLRELQAQRDSQVL
jgi:hypothetical protein